ncbi:hypothetical protein [Burkholderia ubonensis]|uniref:hypothetical protein n=1 Tax=Burkholderia ubonensis TaxID=101571 RepID=UPI000A4AC88D|nr:hypothetical protein [Burkholderia ubonensis]
MLIVDELAEGLAPLAVDEIGACLAGPQADIIAFVQRLMRCPTIVAMLLRAVRDVPIDPRCLQISA